MIPVGWLAPSADCWDSNMLRLLLDGELYPHGLKFRHHAGYPNTDDSVVIVVPGRYYAQHTDKINEAIKRFVSVLMVVTSDEEATFDCSSLLHDRIRFWVQTQMVGKSYGDARLFGVGFPPHFNALLKQSKQPPDKTLDVFLAAQNTHLRRHDAFYMLKDFPNSLIRESEGFTQGMEHAEYAAAMVGAKVAPAPSGAVSPDSFRFWEALEAHCVPIADDISPTYDSAGFWRRMFSDGEPPFPILEDYRNLPGYCEDMLNDWPAKANRVAAWWLRYKRELTLWLRRDLEALGAL